MVRVKHCLLFLSVILCVAVARPSPFGYEPVPAAGGWLRLHSAPATWPDALLRCTLEGGVLASPSSSAIAAAMKSKLAMLQQNNFTTKVFIGVHAALTEEEFVSLDRVPFSNISLAWTRGEPDNKDNNEQCLVMTAAGELADESCSSVFRYFCFKQDPAQIEEPNHELQMAPGDGSLLQVPLNQTNLNGGRRNLPALGSIPCDLHRKRFASNRRQQLGHGGYPAISCYP